jgi:hypothetical protein
MVGAVVVVDMSDHQQVQVPLEQVVQEVEAQVEAEALHQGRQELQTQVAVAVHLDILELPHTPVEQAVRVLLLYDILTLSQLQRQLLEPQQQ